MPLPQRREVRDRGHPEASLDGELVATEAALDELHARVARVTLDDPGDPAAGGAQVRQQLKELSTRLHALERSAADTLKEMA